MSRAYDRLLTESPEYLTCAYGSSQALGLRGSKEAIEKAHTLFVNYASTRNRLHWVDPQLAFFTISRDKVRSAIKLFLYVNLLHGGDVGSYSTWDEDTGTYTLIQDTKRAEDLSAQEADLFMTTIRTRHFIPADYSSAVDHEYRMVT